MTVLCPGGLHLLWMWVCVCVRAVASLYLEVLQLGGNPEVLLCVLSQTGVEDVQLGVSQPHLQVLDPAFQLAQQAAGVGGQGRVRLLGPTGAPHQLPQDLLRRPRREEEGELETVTVCTIISESYRVLLYQYTDSRWEIYCNIIVI